MPGSLVSPGGRSSTWLSVFRGCPGRQVFTQWHEKQVAPAPAPPKGGGDTCCSAPAPAHGALVRQEEGTRRVLQRQPRRGDRDPRPLRVFGKRCPRLDQALPTQPVDRAARFRGPALVAARRFPKDPRREKTFVAFYEKILNAKCSRDPLNYPSQALSHCGPIPWAVDGAARGVSVRGVSTCTALRRAPRPSEAGRYHSGWRVRKQRLREAEWPAR